MEGGWKLSYRVEIIIVIPYTPTLAWYVKMKLQTLIYTLAKEKSRRTPPNDTTFGKGVKRDQ